MQKVQAGAQECVTSQSSPTWVPSTFSPPSTDSLLKLLYKGICMTMWVPYKVHPMPPLLSTRTPQSFKSKMPSSIHRATDSQDLPGFNITAASRDTWRRQEDLVSFVKSHHCGSQRTAASCFLWKMPRVSFPLSILTGFGGGDPPMTHCLFFLSILNLCRAHQSKW